MADAVPNNLQRLIQVNNNIDSLRIMMADLMQELTSIQHEVKDIVLNVQAGMMQDAMENLGIEADDGADSEFRPSDDDQDEGGPAVPIPPPGPPITASPAIIRGPLEAEMKDPYLDDDDEDDDTELTPAQIAVLEKMR